MPPAELLRCPTAPPPLAEDKVAILPAPLRLGLIAVARALARDAEQLARLIRWNDPTACPEESR